MEAQHQRQISSGYQYDNLFPPADGDYTIVNKNGTVKKDTVPLMAKTATENVKDTKKIIPYLKGDRLEDTCHNIWNFIYAHIQYKLDTAGTEEIRTPARAWHDRKTGVDCDCYSVFTSSILLNLGIPHKFRVTKYTGNWQHVYIIVPNSSGSYYTIDPVLDTFNYEKPFTENFDYTMEPTLNGMPLALLSGPGNDEDIAHETVLLGYINGDHFDSMFDEYSLSGPEEIEAAGDNAMDAIFKHLVASRDYILQNPASVLTQGGAPNNLEMLNYAIARWNTPERDAALDLLARKEDEWAAATGRSESTSGLGKGGAKKFFGGIKQAVNSVKSTVKASSDKVKETVKTTASQIKKGDIKGAVKTITKAAGQGIKTAVKGIVKYNPISLAIRGGFLLALRINLFHLASKLAPGYSGDAKAKTAIDKISKLFVDKLQGKPEALKNAIIKGAQKGLFGLGVEPATTAATIAVASVPVATAVIESKNAGLDIPEAAAAQGAETEGAAKQNFVKKIIDWIKGKVDKGVLSPSETSVSAANELAEQSGGEGGGGGGDEDEGKGFFGWVKENPVKTTLIGTTAVGIGIGITVAVRRAKKKKSQAGSTSGLGEHRPKPAPRKRKIKILQLA